MILSIPSGATKQKKLIKAITSWGVGEGEGRGEACNLGIILVLMCEPVFRNLRHSYTWPLKTGTHSYTISSEMFTHSYTAL